MYIKYHYANIYHLYVTDHYTANRCDHAKHRRDKGDLTVYTSVYS